LIFWQVLGLLLLIARTSTAKDVELLMLRHVISPSSSTPDRYIHSRVCLESATALAEASSQFPAGRRPGIAPHSR